MRKIIITFALIFTVPFFYQGTNNTNIVKLRDLYYKAASNKSEADNFYDFLKDNPGINTNVFNAYTGMSYMIKANYSWNPYNKLSFFNKGKDKLEDAIANDSYNAELRFLRFCIQTNAPGFLAYSGKIKEDKAMLMVSYPLIKDEDLKKRIKEYMLDCKYCSTEDKKIFV